MKRAIRSGHDLCKRLAIAPALSSSQAEADFPVFVPLEYVNRMRKGDPDDPLLRQVASSHDETLRSDVALLDPVGDLAAQLGGGVLQKYERRVLLITTGACAVHCRYCFRRHFPYETAPKGKTGWSRSLRLIEQDRSIDEVILSGGDPLTLADESLSWLIRQIGAIGHVQRIRIHTRVPVVIPQRVCESLLKWVRESAKPLFFVMHFNHAQEIDHSVAKSLRALVSAGATVLNQAVLLRGINDSVEAQKQLCLKLINLQVLPYYLHQLDLVQGALHYQVTDQAGAKIVEALRAQLPGYGVPKLVRELAGQQSKTPL